MCIYRSIYRSILIKVTCLRSSLFISIMQYHIVLVVLDQISLPAIATIGELM